MSVPVPHRSGRAGRSGAARVPLRPGVGPGALALLVVVAIVGVLAAPPTARAQTVSDIDPTQGVADTTLHIYGTNLGGLTASDVTIGGTPVSSLLDTVTSLLASNLLKVEVPAGLQGPVAVQVDGQTAAGRFTAVTGGPAAFSSGTTFFSDGDNQSSPRTVARGDIDGDGDLDLVVGFGESGEVLWFENDGTGSFGTGRTITSGFNYPRDLVLADVVDDQDASSARDGALDVVVAGGEGSGEEDGSSNDRIRVYPNQRTGPDDVSFGGEDVVQSSPVDDVRGIAAGDIDFDGDVDLVSVSQDNGRVVRHMNDDGTDSFTNQSVETLSDPRTVALADLGGDDRLDIVVAEHSTSGTVLRLDGNGDGTFDASQPLVSDFNLSNPIDLDVADFSGNGAPGAVVATESSGNAVAFLNTDSGFSRAEIAGTSGASTTVHAADVSGGDGRPEVLLGNAATGEVTWHSADGAFGNAQVLITPNGEPTALATADVDADGDLDPVVLTRTADRASVIPNGSVGPKIVSFPADTTINEDTQTGARRFEVTDLDTNEEDLLVTATSSNPALVPDGNVVVGSDGPDSTVTVTPRPDSNGTATITVSVDDGTSTISDTFTLTVDPVNDAPILTTNAPLRVRNGQSGTVDSTLLRTTDVEDGPSALQYTIDTPPSHGALRLNGEPVTVGFTQADLNAGRLQYVHDSSATATDAFAFTVTDAAGSGLAVSDTFDVAVTDSRLTAERDTVRAGLVPTGQARPLTVRLTNTGTTDLTDLQADLTDARVDGATSAPGDFAVETDLTGPLAPGESRRLRISLAPSAPGRRAAALRLTTAEGAFLRSVLVGHGLGVSLAPQTPTRSEAAPVGLTIEGGYRAGRDTLYVRRGGTETYRAVPLETTAQGPPLELSTQIPGSLVTARGVDYYLRLSSPDGTATVPAGGAQDPRHLPVQFDQLEAPFSLRAERYRMVSVPAAPSDGVKAALEAAYGPYDPSTWRLERWDGRAETYRPYPQLDSLRAGQGFWLVTAGGADLTLPSGRTVDADTARRVPLRAGWNQVGTPFGFAVPWDTVRAASGLTPAAVDGPIAFRDSAYRRSTQLRPWTGYFVFSAEADTLRIPPVGAPSAASSKARAATSAGDPDSDAARYGLRVEAIGRSGRSSTTLGLRADARVGRDRYDRAQPPPLGTAPRIGALVTVGDRTVPHAHSARPAEQGDASAGRGQRWTLRLRRPATEAADEKRPITLRLESIGERPDGWTRYVLDQRRDTRVASGAALRLAPGETRRLTVIVGTEAYAQQASGDVSLSSLDTDLRRSYPNPFADRTTIEYTLAEEQKVTLRIYNVLGQRVRTLVRERQSPGVHRIEWTGTNQHGSPVGSGVYFYRLEAGSVTETQKMVLVR